MTESDLGNWTIIREKNVVKSKGMESGSWDNEYEDTFEGFKNKTTNKKYRHNI